MQPVFSGVVTVLLVILICVMGLKMLGAAIGYQFDFLRGPIIWKAVKRFKKSLFLFAAAITFLALVNEYVSPAVGRAIVATGDGIATSAGAIGSGAASGASAVWGAVPIIVGIVLALAYWTFASVRWFDRARSKEARFLRQVGAFALFMPLMIAYVGLFIA